MSESFVPALRAELEAVVARYEALARAHNEALSATRESQLQAVRAEAETNARERDQARTRAQELERALAALTAKADDLTTECTRLRAQAEQQASQSAADLELLRSELAKTRAHTESLEHQLGAVSGHARALEGAFAQESAFVRAAVSIEGTALHQLLRDSLGEPLEPTPAAYAALKARRPDAILSLALKERGRTAAHDPLADPERKALTDLAQTAGCELIAPAPGTRFSASTMEKAATTQDPAEEGNVLECLVPGLRLAGSEGALVFPKVRVAVG